MNQGVRIDSILTPWPNREDNYRFVYLWRLQNNHVFDGISLSDNNHGRQGASLIRVVTWLGASVVYKAMYLILLVSCYYSLLN